MYLHGVSPLIGGEPIPATAALQSGWTWIFLPVKQYIYSGVTPEQAPWYFIPTIPLSRDYIDARVFFIWVTVALVFCSAGVGLGWSSPRLGVRVIAIGGLLAQAPLFAACMGNGGVGVAWRITGITVVIALTAISVIWLHVGVRRLLRA